AWIQPSDSKPGKPKPIPILAGKAEGETPRLWLSVSFQVRLDGTNKYLAIQQSFFSLVLDNDTGHPAVRIEYERDKGAEPDDGPSRGHRRSAAHVQIHGASEEIAFIQGLNGTKKLRGLDKFHIPVGGRRYRPTLEDFIEFIWMEELVVELHEGWRKVIDEHRKRWLQVQLKSAVRSDPESAITQLTDMGYIITVPATIVGSTEGN
nr:hypothetical protein [Candidatus Nanopelagicaceae bacterium]